MSQGGEVVTEVFQFGDSVSAEPGDDVILSVPLSPDTSAVSMNISWYRESQLIYQYKDGMERPSSGYVNRVSLSVQELERGNLSLILRNVQESDSGDYKLQVQQHRYRMTVIVPLQVRGPTPRRRNSLHRVPPYMRDDGTPETPERESRDTMERVIKSGDQNIR